jgi:hypothetical protein
MVWKGVGVVGEGASVICEGNGWVNLVAIASTFQIHK